MFSVHTTLEEFENWGFTPKTHQMFSVHTTLEELENGGFTLKQRQMLSIHTKPEELKNATITGHFGFVFEENSVRKITWSSWRHRFRKAPFSKCFPSTRKRKAGVFKFLRFEERFLKAPFSWRIRIDRNSNRRNKAVFSNFFGVAWCGPCLRSTDVLPKPQYTFTRWKIQFPPINPFFVFNFCIKT